MSKTVIEFKYLQKNCLFNGETAVHYSTGSSSIIYSVCISNVRAQGAISVTTGHLCEIK